MKYSIFALLLICSACREEKKDDNSIYIDMAAMDRDTSKLAIRPAVLSDPDYEWYWENMKHRHDSIRRFNEIHLKMDSFSLLYALTRNDTVINYMYRDSLNNYWGIVQKERAAQEKKHIKLKR